MRHLVLFDGILHGSGIEVLGENEGAREEAEPEIYGDKAEYVVEGKKRELLELALVVLLYLRALLYYIAAVAYLPEKVLARVGTELDLVGPAKVNPFFVWDNGIYEKFLGFLWFILKKTLAFYKLLWYHSLCEK